VFWIEAEFLGIRGVDVYLKKAKQALTTTMPEQLKNRKQQLLLPMTMAQAVLDQMLAAQTQISSIRNRTWQVSSGNQPLSKRQASRPS
jgi:ribosomal protein S11